jgi:hypothetical protein
MVMKKLRYWIACALLPEALKVVSEKMIEAETKFTAAQSQLNNAEALQVIRQGILDDVKPKGTMWLVREQLGGINPEILRENYTFDRNTKSGNYSEPDVLWSLSGSDNPDGDASMTQENFLAEMHRIRDNKAMARLVSFLMRDQVIHVAKYAEDQARADFGRATINGLSLIRESIERYATMHVELHKHDETDYDRHAAV